MIRTAKQYVVAPTYAAHRWATSLLQRLTPEQHPRRWSNREIERIGEDVAGDVVHVSAWEDNDKYGRTYRSYFPNARSYTTTNFGGARGEGEGSIPLDLSKPLRSDLRGAFDLVFNHTTLEHVYELPTALDNLFAMTRSDLLLIVPFMQVEHWETPSYGDYWRICAHGLIQAAIDHSFKVVSLTSNHNPVWPIYYCLHARVSDGPSASLWDETTVGFGARRVGANHPSMS